MSDENDGVEQPGSVAVRQANERLRDFALTLAEAYEDYPWDEIVVKVNKKIFVFFGLAADIDKRIMLGMKLPQSGEFALKHPFVKPSGYNLGKHGWVTIEFAAGDNPPLELLMDWIEESYRAVAPKRLVAQLDRLRQP